MELMPEPRVLFLFCLCVCVYVFKLKILQYVFQFYCIKEMSYTTSVLCWMIQVRVHMDIKRVTPGRPGSDVEGVAVMPMAGTVWRKLY